MVSARQQPNPPPPLRTMPPLLPKVLAPPGATNISQSDMFLDMIKGPAVTVVVGTGPSALTCTLPKALLSAHSMCFRSEIHRLDYLAHAATANKKRKLSPEDAAPAAEEAETEKDKKETEQHEKKEMVIRLPDVDPDIFGLFSKFIYQGSYPIAVDIAVMVPTTHHAHPTISTPTPTPTPTHHSPYASTPPSLSSNGNSSSPHAPPESHTPDLPSTPNPQPTTDLTSPQLPTAGHGTTAADSVPPSIRAWLLGERLGALSFMNYAITRVHAGIGMHFGLTPSTMAYAWANTIPSTETPESATNALKVFPRPCAVISPSPLRRLLLDVLTNHWSSPAVHIIAKSPSRNTAWNALFDTHADLRRGFIFGMQEGIKLIPLQSYYVTPIPAPPGPISRDNVQKAGTAKITEDVMVVGGVNGAVKKEGAADGVEKSGEVNST